MGGERKICGSWLVSPPKKGGINWCSFILYFQAKEPLRIQTAVDLQSLRVRWSKRPWASGRYILSCWGHLEAESPQNFGSRDMALLFFQETSTLFSWMVCVHKHFSLYKRPKGKRKGIAVCWRDFPPSSLKCYEGKLHSGNASERINRCVLVIHQHDHQTCMENVGISIVGDLIKQ